MKKELNPELFSEKPSKQQLPTFDPQFLNTDKQLHTLRSATENLNDELDRITQSVGQNFQSMNMKIERLSASIARLEHNHNGLANEVVVKINSIQSKINERKSLDIKTQEMMDRYNNILMGFEVRINQLQKIIAEKDAQLLSAQTTLNESKIEIARLKRL